jgi:hypothetical protein
MSVRVMSWVWEQSKSQPTSRLVLLAIADCANDVGAEAYPSMTKLRAKTGLSERAIQGAIQKLVSIGELVVSLNAGPRGCNRYRVILTPAGDAPQQVHPNHPLTIREPSVKASRPTKAVDERPDVEKVCRHLADRIADNGSKRPAITPRWRMAARLLLDDDGRTVEQVIKAIDWSQADGFWRSNVLSMPKLREKYDQLRLAAQLPNGRASPLIEVNGMRLQPKTAANLAGRAKWEAQDQAAIEGPK